MNAAFKWWLYLTTETKEFTNALEVIKEGDIITIEKHLPCYIWENRFEVKQVSYQKFFVSGCDRLWFTRKEPSVPGVEIIAIKTDGRKITKYPSNIVYFTGQYVLGMIGAIIVLLLLVLIVNLII